MVMCLSRNAVIITLSYNFEKTFRVVVVCFSYVSFYFFYARMIFILIFDFSKNFQIVGTFKMLLNASGLIPQFTFIRNS